MSPPVVALVPVLHRPWRIDPVLRSFEAGTPGPHRLLFIVSESDRAVQAAVQEAGGQALVVEDWRHGDYPRKIQAGFDATTEPLIFTGADDLAFHPGWLDHAVAKLRAGVGVVGTNDQCNKRVMRGEHATHLLITRAYVTEHGTIDQRGQVMHTGYWHECCDDELVQTAMARGAWAFAADSIVEHLHPDVGKAPVDAMYAAQAVRLRQGRALLNQRRPLWEGPGA